jgi:hypothetical protein
MLRDQVRTGQKRGTSHVSRCNAVGVPIKMRGKKSAHPNKKAERLAAICLSSR